MTVRDLAILPVKAADAAALAAAVRKNAKALHTRVRELPAWRKENEIVMKKSHFAAVLLFLAAAMGALTAGYLYIRRREKELDEYESLLFSEDFDEDEATEAEEPAEEAAEEPAAEVAVMSYEEYMAAELDSQVTIEACVQAKQSWWEDKATVYAQDENGAYFLYNMACSEEDYAKLTEGTRIRVTGYKAEWSGEVEIMDGTFTFVEGDSYIAEPIDATSLLSTEELIDHQNQFAQFKGLTVEAAGQDEAGNDVAFLYNWDGSGSQGDDLYFNVSYNGETYTFTVESYLCDSTTEVYAAVEALQVGQVIDAEGFLYWYEGLNPHITSVTVVG